MQRVSQDVGDEYADWFEFVRQRAETGKHLLLQEELDIYLARGAYTASREISLVETDSADQLLGTFLLHFAEHDSHSQTAEPLQAEVLCGKWLSADGKMKYPVYLQVDHECTSPGQSRYAIVGSTSDEVVEKNAKAFFDAVVAGNRSIAAKCVSYPATFFDNGKGPKITGSSDFLKVYEEIFTSDLVAQIAKSIPHHMFVNSPGIMPAAGRVCFDADGKAKHFNNQAQ